MKTIIYLFLLNQIISLPVFAAKERGNGGDGVVNADGSIMLFDYFERRVDADKLFSNVRRVGYIGGHVRNFYFEKEIKDHVNNREVFWNGSNHDFMSLVQTLGYMLNQLADVSPTLAHAVLQEIKDLEWTEAPVDLKPSHSTQSALNDTLFRPIGCAETTNGITLYSPSCARKMNYVQRAGLAYHEAVYSVYSKLHPQAETSFDVRTIVAKTLDFIYLPRDRDVLIKHGFGQYVKNESPLYDQLRELRKMECIFAKGHFKKLVISWSGSGLYSIQGSIDNLSVNSVVGSQEAEGHWGQWSPDYWQWIPETVELINTDKAELKMELFNELLERSGRASVWSYNLTLDLSKIAEQKVPIVVEYWELDGRYEDEQHYKGRMETVCSLGN